MHEHHQVAHLIKQIEIYAQEKGLKKIPQLTVIMGEALGFDEGSVQLYFETLGQGTLLEGSKISFKKIPAELFCAKCQKNFIKKTSNLDCPNCGQQGTPTNIGKEFSFILS